jgi:hypothetical protein
MLLALLLTAGAGAAVFATTAQARLGTVDKAELDRLGRIDQLHGWLTEISATQHAYVAPGQPLQPALDRVATLLPRVQSEVGDLAAVMQSAAARATIERLSASIRTIIDADSSAREQLASGQFLWAAEIMFGPAREAHADAIGTLRELRDAGRRATAEADAAATRRTWIAIAATATLWTLGLFLLVPVPAKAAPPSESSESDGLVAGHPKAAPTYEAASTYDVEAQPPPSAAPAPLATPIAPPSPATGSIDLAATAAICTDISRVTSGDQVGALLGRIASTLHATGVIVWMGAGEELFAAAAAGYDARLLSRMGAISRSADNAVATAWRTCELRIVKGGVIQEDGAGGDGADGAAANGAIVAPMFGPDACIGVLAIETPPHREADTGIRAVTEMFAAQLATTLAAWPAPSVAADSEMGRLQAAPADFRMPKASGA